MSPDPKTSIDRSNTGNIDTLASTMRPALVKFFTRKCGRTGEAEDLAQDVLVRALAHSAWKSVEEAKGYIFRAAINRWHDRQRRAAAHGINVEWDDAAAFALDVENSPERVLVVQDELHRVVSALEGLSERARDVFMLIRVERMRQAQIAALFGISVSAVEKHYARALAHLAHIITPAEGS